MKAITIEQRREIIDNITGRIKREFNTKRERFDFHISYINGNVPHPNYYFNDDKEINLSFGFYINITPKYVLHFKEGEIERLKTILVEEAGEYGRVFFRQNRNPYVHKDILSLDLVMVTMLDNECELVELNKKQRIF